MPRPAEVSRAYLRIVLQAGVAEPTQLLRGTTLTEESLRALEFVPAADLATVFRNYQTHTTSRAWTAELGAMFNIASHGPMGFAALSAPTLGEALDVIAALHPSRISAIESARHTTDSRVIMEIRHLTPDAEFGVWLVEILMKISESLMAAILGHPVGRNVEITFTHSAPENAELLVAAYDAKVRFDGAANTISLPLAWYSLPSPMHDETAYRTNLIKCRELIAQREQSDSVAFNVRNHLLQHFDAQLLRAGAATSPPTLEQMAESMATTPRTLIRRLQRENANYKDIVETLRREYAERLLRDARHNIADIADILGYREAANFGRAFKRWYGVSPAIWRKQ